MPSAILMTCRPGSVIGAPLMRPESFRNAIMEPVNVMAPMATPSDISIRLWPWIAPSTPMPNAAGADSAPAATSTAAMPTSEWNAATSSGIDVIGTRRAITAPIEPPMATPRITSTQAMPSAGGCAANVGPPAIAMPIMPKKLPRRDDAGLDSPRSDRMNRTPATRYKTADRLAFISQVPLSSSPRGGRRSLGFLLVHRDHPLGDQEATEDVHAGEDQRDEAEAARPHPAAADQLDADREQRTDHDHRGDRIGHRHQRRMQRRRHRPHHEVADEHGEHENRQPEHEGIDGLRDMIHGGSPVSPSFRDGAARRTRNPEIGLQWRFRVRSLMRAPRNDEKFCSGTSLRALRLEVRMNDGAVSGQGGGLDQFV